MIKVKCKEKEQKNKINAQDSILEENKGQIENPGNMTDEYNPDYEINQIKLNSVINFSLNTAQQQYSDQRSNSIHNENKNDFDVKLEISNEEDLKQTQINNLISNKYPYKHNNALLSIDNVYIPKKLQLNSNEPIETVRINMDNGLLSNINSETRELISHYSNNQLQTNIENQIEQNSNIDNQILEQENQIHHIQPNNNIIPLNQNNQEGLALIRRQQIALNQLVKDRYSSLLFTFLLLMVLFFLILMITKFSMSYFFLMVFLLFVEILAIINTMKTLYTEVL